MARLIDADALMDAFRTYMVERYDREKCVSEENCKTCDKPCLWRSIVIVAPTVDAVPVRHGHWIMNEYDELYCSVCGDIASLDSGEYFYRGNIRFDDSFYCPNCGAKMDEEVNE